ncbi:MAG: AAA family ATPase, partial [Candidatus Omnitrophica bacterium]|nr:AAA family ATPase [Candidatus Omnitrophota bacterium]
MDLFETRISAKDKKAMPLAARMRPRDLKEFLGQEHILGKDKLLRRAIEADRLSSLILYGPPGSGKTSLAYCISNITKSEFLRINAVTSNVEELRKIIASARNRENTSAKRTILFIDEIHRFNKAQQDVLTPDVEEATVILIGATVHNPFFSLVSPLLSRSLVFELHPLKEKEISQLLNNALKDKERGLGNLPIKIQEDAIKFLSKVCDGDARRALN